MHQSEVRVGSPSRKSESEVRIGSPSRDGLACKPERERSPPAPHQVGEPRARRRHASFAGKGMHAKPPLPTFQVLDLAIETIEILAPVVARIRRDDRDLADQLRRSLSSVALNVAEGNRSQGGHTASRASARRQARTRSRVRRCAWQSPGATCRRETKRRAKRGSTASRPCCTAWGLGAEPRSSGLSIRSFERHPTVQPWMPRSLVDAPNPYGTTLPPCVERSWPWLGRPCKFAMSA